jgi:large subunit ribosomal protein L25
MSEQLTLPAEARDRAGKGASRHCAADGRVPAVVYGEKQDPFSIHVEEKLLSKMLSSGHFMNSVVMIDAGGQSHRTLPKAVDFPPGHQPADPRRLPAHRRAQPGRRQRSRRFDDEEQSPGIKRGGVLNVVRHELELICDAASIRTRSTSASTASISATASTFGGQLPRAASPPSTTATSPIATSSLRRR